MTDPRPGIPGRDEPRIDARTRRIIDALLDGELTQREMREQYEAIRNDPAAREELARLRYAVAQLRAPADTPDLSGAILHRASCRRRFLPSRSRRMITAGRCAAAAGLVVVVALMSLAQRHVPLADLSAEPRPVTRLVESARVPQEISESIVTGTVETIEASLASPVARLTLDRRLHPESEYRYDVVVTSTPPASPTKSARATVSRAPLAVQTGFYEPVAAAQRTTPHPFIGRFDSLLVVLRDPTPLANDRQSEGDER